MRLLARFVFALCAVTAVSCGSPQRPGGGGSGGGGGDGGDGTDPAGGSGGGDIVAQGSGPGVTPDNVCARIAELKTQGCQLSTLSDEECRDELHRALEERGPESRTATVQLGRCLLDNESCDAIAACVDGLVAEEAPRTCEQGGGGAVALPRAEWDQRRGAGATRYSSVTTTKAEPVEVCGIPAQMEWLLAAACDDGSRPFRDFDHAHAARVGNVGPGGRCGSIVDLYEVPCPEGTYSIYIDAYICPEE